MSGRLHQFAVGVACALSLLAPALLGCHGGSPGHQVTLLGQVRWKWAPEVYRAVPSGERDRLTRAGIVFDDASNVLVFPRTAIHGWLRIGDRIVPVSAEGVVDIPAIPASVTSVEYVHSPGDLRPRATIPAALLIPGSQITVPLTYRGPLGMNGDEDPVPGGRAHHEAHIGRDVEPSATTCPPGTKSPCCEDQNGPLGDLRRYTEGPQRYINFINSTCFQWVLKGCCTNEGAELLPLLLGEDDVSCYDNHKSRNCQDLNEALFSVAPERFTILCGQRRRISVRNNTCGNETLLFPGDGFLGRLEGVEPGGAGYQLLKHYDNAHPRVNHFVEREFVYIAPASLPGGATEVTTTLRASTNGSFRLIQITIRCTDGPSPTPTPGTTLNRAPRLLRFENVFLPDLHSNAVVIGAEDPDGDALTYEWSWSGPATGCGSITGSGSQGPKSHVFFHEGCTFSQESATKVKVIVRDGRGGEAVYEHGLRDEGDFDLTF